MQYLFLIYITSVLITLFSVPSLIKVAYLKRIFDNPDEGRKIHKRSIPTIGGIIIFASTIFSYSLWYPIFNVKDLKYLIASSILLFFVGIKDDIIGIAPVKKLISFFAISVILVLLAEIRITSMHGLFGIYSIPLSVQIILSIFTIVAIINAINLIDGIDGLASGIGLIISLFFGFWFFMQNELSMSCLSFALAGTLSAFLLFNFSPAKIFMGDSGSLTIGLIIAVLSIKCIEYNVRDINEESLVTLSRPVFVLALLSYPLYDSLRVILLRTLKGNSPFLADKNHIHHRLLSIGCTHATASIYLYASTIIIVLLVLYLRTQTTMTQFLSAAILTICLGQIPFLFKEKK